MTINSQDRVDLGIFDTLVQWSDRRVYLGPTPGFLFSSGQADPTKSQGFSFPDRF